MLHDFLTKCSTACIDLCTEAWFQQLLHCWGQRDPLFDPLHITQQDSAEFVVTWLEHLQSPAFDMKWERRFVENADVKVFDCSHSHAPLCLKFSPFLADLTSCDMTQLFRVWRQVDGMCTALCQAPPCLCVHVDRCVQTQQQQIYKSECMLQIDEPCLVPVYRGGTLDFDHVEYQAVALTAHIGVDAAGHFRAALKLAPSVVPPARPASWLLTDDWTVPTPFWDLPPWMKRNATMYWLVRTDCIKLWSYRLPQTDAQTAEIEAAILAMLPMPK